MNRTLAAVHQEGKVSTQYSNIYDLVNLQIYLYHFHNFEEVVTIDLREELAKGKHESRIRDLFNESFAARNYRLQWENEHNSNSAPPSNIIIIVLSSGVALAIGSLAGASVAVSMGWMKTGRIWKGIVGGTFGALLGGAGTSAVATLIPALSGWPKDFFFWGNGPMPALIVVPLLAIIFAVLGAVLGAVIRGRRQDKKSLTG